MPDTEENQAEYPQTVSQEEGLGFPMMRGVGLTSLATGMVIALALGPYAGKETGETALFRSLFDQLKTGDLVLSDRYYGGWFMLALLQELGVEFVTRLHQFRTADFRQGKSLGKDDHVVTWPKPQRPKWLDQETYDRLPDHLEVREIKVNVDQPGFRTESLVVVTSLRDHRRYKRDVIAEISRRRWIVELDEETRCAPSHNARMGEARTLDGTVGLQPDQAVNITIRLGGRMPTKRAEFCRIAPDALKCVGACRCSPIGFDQCPRTVDCAAYPQRPNSSGWQSPRSCRTSCS